MSVVRADRAHWFRIVAVGAILFGLLTIRSGGAVLWQPEARQAAGNAVDFVVWFNFLAGFAYVVAGIGLWGLRRWSIWLALAIAGSTLLVFATFGLHVLLGGSYEGRTVAAMILRSGTWLGIAAIAYRYLKPVNPAKTAGR